MIYNINIYMQTFFYLVFLLLVCIPIGMHFGQAVHAACFCTHALTHYVNAERAHGWLTLTQLQESTLCVVIAFVDLQCVQWECRMSK